MGARGVARCTRATPQRYDRRATQYPARQAASSGLRVFYDRLLVGEERDVPLPEGDPVLHQRPRCQDAQVAHDQRIDRQPKS